MKLDNNKKELVENLFAEYGKTELTRSEINEYIGKNSLPNPCLLYTSPSPRDPIGSRMPSSA